MSGGKLYHAVGPATQNARLPRCRLVRGTTSDIQTTSEHLIVFLPTMPPTSNIVERSAATLALK